MKARLVAIGLILALIVLLIPTTSLSWSPYGYGPYPGYGGPDYPEPGPGYFHHGPGGMPGFRVTREADRDNYYVNIRLNGIDPQAVKVEVEGGRWLVISRDDSKETHEENVAEDRTSWSRSYSYHSGQGTRRFSLPRDADTNALQREDGSDLIKITIPRNR